MIWESGPWKREVARAARWLNNVHRMEWGEAEYARLEIHVFTAFYCVRKLFEADKLTTALEKVRVKVDLCPFIGKGPVHKLNWPKLDKHYDLKERKQEKLRLWDLCNQVIHSFVFAPEFRPSKQLIAIYVASDRQKQTGLYRITRARLVRLLKLVADDDVWSEALNWNEQKKDYDSVRLGMADTPKQSPAERRAKVEAFHRK